MASNDTPKTIDLWGVGVQNEAAVTDAVVTPGMLLARTAGGVRPHNVAGGTASPAFAVENEWIGGTISDNYAIGENCYFRTFAQGSAVYAILAASQTISVGDLLLEVLDLGLLALAGARLLGRLGGFLRRSLGHFCVL